MQDIFDWFMVMANNKAVTVIIFIITFSAIIIYVYGNKKRSKRFEEYRNIPFLDDDYDQRIPDGHSQDKTTHIEGEK